MMGSKRKAAVIIGILFLFAAVTSIIAVILYAPLLDNPQYIASANAPQTRILLGAFFEVMVALSLVGTSIMLFPILKQYNESLALGAACFRTLESAIIILGIICLVTITSLHGDLAAADQQTKGSYLFGAKLLLTLHKWTFLFGPNFMLGPSTLFTSYILFKTKLVPRPIAMLGLIGGPLIFICATMVLFGWFEQVSTWGAILAIPVFCYEMSLAIYLIIRGFIQSENIPSRIA